MNCQDFNDVLYDLLDETLDGETHDAAHAHLRQCDGCRGVFLREKAIGKTLRHSLDRATARLSLLPDTKRFVMQASQSRKVQSNPCVSTWQRFISALMRPIGATVAFVCVLLVYFALQFHRRATAESGRRTLAQIGQATYVVEVPIESQAYVFHLRNNTVVDAIVPSVAVGRAYLLENIEH